MRDTITVIAAEGGYRAKLHGYPFYFSGGTIEECLRHAGQMLDDAEKQKREWVATERQGKDECKTPPA